MSKSLQELLSLKGKTAVITGGAGYLKPPLRNAGRIGRKFVIASRDKEKCERKAAELEKQFSKIRAVGLGVDLLRKGSGSRLH